MQRIHPQTILHFIFGVFLLLANSACKKFIQVRPPVTSLTNENVYTSDKSAAAVMTDIYASFSDQNVSAYNSSASLTSLFVQAGLSADELELYDLNDQVMSFYYRNDLRYNRGAHFWNDTYPVIYICNAVIQGVSKANNLTPAVKMQLLGEAKFMRAFCYFYLVNLYGDVPLSLTSDYTTNAMLPRLDKEKVYDQIVADLKEAQELLRPDYVDGGLINTTTQRIRPNRWVAAALLARVYLYRKDWANAGIQSTAVIDNKTLYDTVSINNVFLMNSRETIWALQPVGAVTNSSANTGEGKFFILPETGPNTYSNQVYLSSHVIDAFESVSDKRRQQWVASMTAGGVQYYYAYKYKVGQSITAPTSEYPVIMRLGEQYLIRAEARAALGDLGGSKEDLDVIRTRAGLPGTTAADAPGLSNAIMHERQVELFTEWGHRWLDLKRTGRIHDVMTQVAPGKDGASWADSKALFPIPLSELQSDAALRGHQNPGYPE